MSTASITIGICTFRRPHVVDTLAALSKQILPLNMTLTILVVDNDETPSAQVSVAQAATEYGLNVTYLHAPASNISIARNACLAAARTEFFAFLDDDELPETLWISELLERQRATGADVVLGPVIALYPPYCPRWMAIGNFHSTAPDAPNAPITTGYAGNVLLKLTSPALTNLRFDERFASNGGEDTDFFSRAHKAGARIAYAEKAIAYEVVPQSRATLGWLLKRRYRYGQIHADSLLAANKPRVLNLALATAKMLVCYAMVLLTCLMPIVRRRWLLRGTLHLGVVRELQRARIRPAA